MQNTVLTFVEDLYEDLELWYPLLRLQEAGYAIVDFLQANARSRGRFVGPAA